MESAITGEPIDGDGNPVPWMNYAVIELLTEILSEEHIVFEWGSGSSTLFFAQRVSEVHSIEHEELWFAKLKLLLPSNSNISFIPIEDPDGYAEALRSFVKTPDLIVIDGRYRVRCFSEAINLAKDNGTVLLLDDSQRERYAEAFKLAKQHELQHLNIGGFGPLSADYETSTLFFHRNNRLDL